MDNTGRNCDFRQRIAEGPIPPPFPPTEEACRTNDLDEHAIALIKPCSLPTYWNQPGPIFVETGSLWGLGWLGLTPLASSADRKDAPDGDFLPGKAKLNKQLTSPGIQHMAF